MKKFLEKSFMAANEVAEYILLPAVIVFAVVICADAQMFGLSTVWTAVILSAIAMLWGLYRWDHLMQIRIQTALDSKRALLDARANALLEEGRKVISEEEGQFWWEDHIEDVMSWSEQITGCGKEA